MGRLTGCTEIPLQPANRLASTNFRTMEDDVQALLQARRYPQAFERLLEDYENKVYRMAGAILRNPARAEEVTQDIFLKIWKALPNYDGRATPGTWLYAIARNTCLAAARAESYRKTVPLDPSQEPASAPQASNDVVVYVERLPAVQRQVITLFYLQDRSVEEVARMLDIPGNTIKSHLRRARLALAEMMKE